MVTFKYVLFYSERNKIYRLRKVKNDGFNPKNPNVIWVFNPDKISIAKKILKNMNLAIENSLSLEGELRIAS